MKQIILLLVVMSAAVFAFLFGNEADEIYPAALAILALMLAVVLVVQAGALLIVHRALKALAGRQVQERTPPRLEGPGQ